MWGPRRRVVPRVLPPRSRSAYLGTGPRSELDLRFGGTTVVTKQPPAQYCGWSVRQPLDLHTAIVEPTRNGFTSPSADDDGQAVAPVAPGVLDEVPHAVGLEPLPDGRTRGQIDEVGCTDEAARQHSEQGQRQVLEKDMGGLFTR